MIGFIHNIGVGKTDELHVVYELKLMHIRIYGLTDFILIRVEAYRNFYRSWVMFGSSRCRIPFHIR